MAGILTKIRTTLEMIKWEHSIFALPFALTAMLLAAGGLPGWRTVAWIVVAMVAARSAAMAFNRWADADLDAENPRTKNRAIPAGLLTRKFVLGFICAAVVVFLVAAAELNRLTLELAPLALVVLLGYSYLKRFTRWSHLGLGLALGLAPTAAWIAVRGSLDPRILVLTAAVTLWAGGFDVLYACQDYEHDRAAGLHSLPQAVGIRGRVPCRPRHACGCALGAGVVRAGSSILGLRAGWASSPWVCCWPTNTPSFRRATCAA